MSGYLGYWLLSALTIGVCLFAVWKGSMAERAGAILILGVIAAGRLLDAVLADSLNPILQLVTDAVTALGLLAVTLRYASFWLGGAMLLYAVQFTLHSFYLVTARPNDLFHAWVNNVNFLLISVCLAAGTVVAWRRRVNALAEARAATAPDR